MTWDALRDRDTGALRHAEEPKLRGSRRPNSSSRPPAGLVSQNPRGRSLRARDRSGAPAHAPPAVIEEELWFGGHDPAAAEDTAASSMAALVGRIVGAKPFPESARRLADLTRKEVIRIEPIIQVLERDPALSVRLLRLVNSAGYALRQRCTSVRHAATLVGTDRLHQIATTAAVLDLFEGRGSIAARIIEHSTIVGAFCRYLGAHLALPVDDLFTAGFLHDIGKLMLLETEGDQYVELLEKFADQPDAIHIAERSLYGFDHAVLAAHVLNAWDIPDPVPKIVAWHHDATRAYGISSMMAALVQTVRLADAAVYAMVRGVTQNEFCTLATTESASYLDISEPQLAAMWDELLTLFRESVEQCRGENAPALDPRSLRPKQPLSVKATQDQPRSTELPLQFPCVVCGGPTFGNTCSACGGHMCPEHQVGREAWCTLCARDYHHEESEAPSSMSPRLAALVGLPTVAVSVAIGYQSSGVVGGVRAGFGTLLLLALAAVLTLIGRRLLLRFRFVRTRPNRNIVEALENDGGVQSLVPPSTNEPMSAGDAHRDPLSGHFRLSGAVVERVVISELPSIPAIIAPRPFDGLHGSSLLCSPQSVDERSLEVPVVPPTTDVAYDADRVRMQSMSLVTLPAPAIAQGDDHDHDRASCDGSLSAARSAAASATNLPHHSSPGASEPRAEDRCDGPIQPIPIEVPKAELSPDPSHLGVARPDAQAEDSPVALVPNATSSTAEATPPAPMVRTHPLAALGLHPDRAMRRPELRKTQPGTGPSGEPEQAPSGEPEQAPSGEPEPTPTTQYQPEERNTLLGLTADEELNLIAQRQAATADTETDAEASSSEVDSPAVQTELLALAVASTEPEAEASLPRAEAPAVDVPDVPAIVSPEPTIGEVVPLAKFLKSEPPLAPKVPSMSSIANPDDLVGPLVAALCPEILSKLGPNFEAKVADLVAKRVANAVAEHMLHSFGQSTAPQARSAPPRTSLATATEPEVPEKDAASKRPRKRIGKH
jgi:HD-like signal output (HDOD) protein